jgi:hypothetical protein
MAPINGGEMKGKLMQPFFSSGGSVGATGEASVREEEEGVQWAGPAGRPWPTGGGEENRPVKEKED